MSNRIAGFNRLPVVIGEGNRLAVYVAKKVVAGDVDDSLNPLVFAGPSGCGKTRLLSAIAEGVACGQDGRTLVSLTGRKLFDEYIAALSDSTVENFRQKYVHADILILDEFEFFAKGKILQEEVYAIIDSLLRNGKQIVAATSVPMKELAEQMCDKLIGRMSSGAVVEIGYPDETMKRRYLQFALNGKGIELPEAEIEALAKSDGKSFWDMKGLVGRAVVATDRDAADAELEEKLKERREQRE